MDQGINSPSSPIGASYEPLPLPSQQPATPPLNNSYQAPQQPSGRKFNKKWAALGVAILLIVALPLTILMVRQQQTTTSSASQGTLTDATVVGNFNGQITVGDLAGIISEQYDSSSLHDKDAIVLARDVYVERQILDQQAQNFSQSDIDNLAANTGLTQIQAKYELLKQQVILNQVNYVKAVSIGYWTPPSDEDKNYSTDVQDVVSKQNQEGKDAIVQAGNQLANQDVLAVAQSIYTNPAYSDLAPILALNGSKFAQIDDADKDTAVEPVLYEYGDTNFDNPTRDLIFNAIKDAVVTTNQPDKSSGGQVVFKITDKGNGSFDSYISWLAEQEKNYTRIDF